jgi:hypothetical protein
MTRAALFAFAFLGTSLWCELRAAECFVTTRSVDSADAHQAAAVDDRFIYAVSSTRVAKVDRKTGEVVELSTGEAKHLNSAYFFNGRLYCAHSNYPRLPEKSEIMVLDPQTMRISVFKEFGDYRGSLTWAVREGEFWWCTFAKYGDQNAQTVLVRFDSAWKETGVWTYPAKVLRELGRYSISGGTWREDHLLVTGHDRRVIYQLRVPREGSVLEHVATIPSPFPGQGIATDPVTGGIVGIDRAKKQVIFAESRLE